MDIPETWQDCFLLTREIPGLGLCGVQRFIYSCGLLTNMRFDRLTYAYDARYCYPIARDALRDLLEWDGQGDPPGDWIKEKVTGRSRKCESCFGAGTVAGGFTCPLCMLEMIRGGEHER